MLTSKLAEVVKKSRGNQEQWINIKDGRKKAKKAKINKSISNKCTELTVIKDSLVG